VLRDAKGKKKEKREDVKYVRDVGHTVNQSEPAIPHIASHLVVLM
jgi:hypothetical protein